MIHIGSQLTNNLVLLNSSRPKGCFLEKGHFMSSLLILIFSVNSQNKRPTCLVCQAAYYKTENKSGPLIQKSFINSKS